MKRGDIFPGWFRILQGRTPLLSIEITKECPLRCPGCYAYQPDHLGDGLELREISAKMKNSIQRYCHRRT